MSKSTVPTRSRRTFSATFKSEVVLILLSGEKTQAELCREHLLSPTLLHQWKATFLQNAAAVFAEPQKSDPQTARIADLEQALGRATLENEILKKASALLNRNGGKPS